MTLLLLISLQAALTLAPVAGTTNPHLRSRAALCAPTFHTRIYRNVTLKTKRLVCARDHAPNCPGPAWEIDHDIPLELGGSNNLHNLWAQKIEEAKLKDTLEGRLRRMVCAGKIALPDAQKCIAENWVKCVDRYPQ